MTAVERYQVEFEGEVAASVDDLHDLGLQVAEALDDSAVEDPFVHTDTARNRLRVEGTVLADDQTEALGVGVRAIVAALRSVGLHTVQGPSARAAELLAA